jgi:two-component system LytT family sensor kinase
MKRSLTSILLHILFWAGVWFLFFYFFNYNSTDRGYVIWFSSLLLPLTAAITYFSIYFLIPQFLFNKAYGHFLLYSFYMLIASAYFIVLMIYGVLIFYKKFDASQIPPMVKNFFTILILVYLVVGGVSFVTILRRSFEIEKRNRDLRNKMLDAQLQMKDQELLYLKKQIHPHFLFNTINTIYGFALKKSSRTPDIILKLSNLLDYILYRVDQPMVPLREEVLHIREYIELEQIRFRDTLKVELNETEIDEKIQVAPMLLIPLVENAFKHGGFHEGLMSIKIQIQANTQELDFLVENPIRRAENDNPGKGIGLENLRKRLDLVYGSDYTLESEPDEGWYRARLQIRNLKNIHA